MLSGAAPPAGRLCPAGQPRRDMGRCGDVLGCPRGSPLPHHSPSVGRPGSWGWGLRWLQGAWGGVRGRSWDVSAEMPGDARSREVMGPGHREHPVHRGNLIVYPWEAEVFFKEKHVARDELSISSCPLMKD